MSSRIALPVVCALALLTPLVPAVIVPRAANVAAGAAITAFLIVPVVVLRRRRWAPLLGAGLLALLAVAAATPPITGLGMPSEEEVRQAVEMHYAVGGLDAVRAFSGDALRFLLWDGDELLLIALACLVAAALLLVLDRIVRPRAPRELLPLRWRWPLVMWGAALVLVGVPQAMLLVVLAGGPSEVEISIMDSACFGNVAELMTAAAVLMLLPQPLVVAVGFGLWALLARTGHRPAARVAGWLTVVPLAVRDLMVNWLPVLGCTLDEEQVTNPVTPLWVLYALLPVVLILLAVRLRRAR
ncbi:hypothetical protein [Nonomuraea rubra]|uniref:hypothetical protein n=1 Tax=Nonomuraea rubra TaxID=46180 RepID=UPI0033D8120E